VRTDKTAADAVGEDVNVVHCGIVTLAELEYLLYHFVLRADRNYGAYQKHRDKEKSLHCCFVLLG
jgi:hypothetical protein